jgi:hypothetical protein
MGLKDLCAYNRKKETSSEKGEREERQIVRKRERGDKTEKMYGG